MRILVRPSGSPQLPIDVTNSIVAAVARELSRVQSGDEEHAWLEAELLVEAMVGRSMVGPCEPKKRNFWEDRLREQRELEASRSGTTFADASSRGIPRMERSSAASDA